jgi:hypothetical protein
VYNSFNVEEVCDDDDGCGGGHDSDDDDDNDNSIQLLIYSLAY